MTAMIIIIALILIIFRLIYSLYVMNEFYSKRMDKIFLFVALLDATKPEVCNNAINDMLDILQEKD